MESTLSTPFSHTLYSGQMKALPAYAASTCSHKNSSSQTWATSSKLSKAQAPVVPRVAQTYAHQNRTVSDINPPPQRPLLIAPLGICADRYF